ERLGMIVGLVAAVLLGLGSISPLVQALHVGSIPLGSIRVNFLALPGHLAAVALAIVGAKRLWAARRELETPSPEDMLGGDMARVRPSLTDLSILAFIASLAFMALEMDAG